MKLSNEYNIFDPLYGEVTLPSELLSLLWLPILQRLRHIRLSNIDSFEMPGIANISRYEHSIGVAYLSSKVSFLKKLSHEESIVFQAAALLHDWDITPFGHLIQEAFQYVLEDYEHENELYKIVTNVDSKEIGGLSRQLLFGRELGIDKWALKTFKTEWQKRLEEISRAVKGEGLFGKCITSTIDLDNLDNVLRIAYHMGLDVDRSLPVMVAQTIDVSKSTDSIVFHPDAIELIKRWLSIRQTVYSHLMLARLDFSAKAMLIQSAIWAHEQNIIHKCDWGLTEFDYTQRLLSNGDDKIRDIMQRWMTGELWDLSELYWLKNPAPEFSELLKFNDTLQKKLGRECFCYRIKDKRTRKLNIKTSDGNSVALGAPSNQWLFGVVTSKRKEFTLRENKLIVDEVCSYFRTTVINESDKRDHLNLQMFK